jgi:hypothetical protein
MPERNCIRHRWRFWKGRRQLIHYLIRAHLIFAYSSSLGGGLNISPIQSSDGAPRSLVEYTLELETGASPHFGTGFGSWQQSVTAYPEGLRNALLCQVAGTDFRSLEVPCPAFGSILAKRNGWAAISESKRSSFCERPGTSLFLTL